MSTFKTLSPSDKFRIPFNSNKLFSFDSSSAASSSVNITIQTLEHPTASLSTFSGTGTDTFNSIKYCQLDHLFYKDNRINISNKLGDADYLVENRTLYNKVNVLSIPSRFYGNKIQPGSFLYSGNLNTIVDDKKGNLLISGTQLISHSIDEREKIFNLGPIKGFKNYNINYNLYGKATPNPLTYYNQENVFDDSFYNNILNYQNITFSEENYGNNQNVSSLNFVGNAGINHINNGDIEDGSDGWYAYLNTTASVSDYPSNIPSLHHPGPNHHSYKYIVSQSNGGLRQDITTLKPDTLYEIQWDFLRPTGSTDVTNQITFTSTTHPTSGNSYVQGNPAYIVNTWKRSRKYMRTNVGSTAWSLSFTPGGLTTGSTDTGPPTFYIDNISVKEVNDEYEPQVFSSVKIPHNETYNFNPGEDFVISMYIKPEEGFKNSNHPIVSMLGSHKGGGYLICKSTIEKSLPIPIYQQKLNENGSSQLVDLKTKNQYPFEVFIDHGSMLTFRKSDGTFTPTVTTYINTGSLQHIVCMTSASEMSIWISGSKIAYGTDTTTYQTENKSDLYIGSKGELSHFYKGSMSNLMIFNSSRTKEQIKSISSSINGSPYIGNIFYSNGLATVTHPQHQEIFKPITAQVQRYYPLNSTAISTTANLGLGSFKDLSRHNQDSTKYVNSPVAAAGSMPTNTTSDVINTNTATFETVTHNDFTGELLLISSSISSSLSKRGREHVEIPNYHFDRTGKWSMSWVMKEAKGYHGTGSFFIGADLNTAEPSPFNNSHIPAIFLTGTGYLYFRDYTGKYWYNNASSLANAAARERVNHCVFTYDGTDQTNALFNTYINGLKIGSTITKDISGHKNSGSFGIDALGAGYRSSTSTYGYSGSLGQVMFFDHMLTTESIQALNNNPSEGAYGNIMDEVSFKNIHPIYENEYQCTINHDEYNFTHNISTRKIKSDQKPDLANFATGSTFRPYVTTVGLYNENHEMLVVGKLGQPVKMSNETDTTFVLRWDT